MTADRMRGQLPTNVALPRTDELDLTRQEAWSDLRDIAAWGGHGTPAHEEGRRIITAATRNLRIHRCRANGGCIFERYFHNAVEVIDPTGQAYPIPYALITAWTAIKENA